MPGVVISVQHSGTRSLQKYLFDGGSWYHFISHPDFVQRGYLRLHVPIRNPFNVARSWAQRYAVRDGLAGIEHMKRAYRIMFECLTGYEGELTLYRMEDLDAISGIGEHAAAPDVSDAIRLYQLAVAEHVIDPYPDFWMQFYGATELEEARAS